MVNDVILKGIRQAVSRGATLQQAMLSFFNAGYPREEIQEAARQFQLEQYQISHPAQQPVQKQIPMMTQPPVQNSSLFQKTTQQTSSQQISSYPPQRKSISKGLVIGLIIILVILLGVLGATIVFKEQIINFFNGI